MKGLEVRSVLFITYLETTTVTEARQTSFNHIAATSQTAAVRRTARTEQRYDAHRSDAANDPREAVAAITEQRCGSAARSAALLTNARQGTNHCQGRHIVSNVCGGRMDKQGQTPGVGDHVAFAAPFSAIDGTWSGVRPPKTARIEAESMTAADKSTSPSWPRRSSNFRCRASQTPALVQSRSRRQQVEPLTPKHSVGSNCHEIPLRSTKMMPRRHSRSSAKSLPPLGWGGCGGISDLISSHNASGKSSVAISRASMRFESQEHVSAISRAVKQSLSKSSKRMKYGLLSVDAPLLEATLSLPYFPRTMRCPVSCLPSTASR